MNSDYVYTRLNRDKKWAQGITSQSPVISASSKGS